VSKSEQDRRTRTREEAIDCFWRILQKRSHTHTREEALLENSPKVHFGTPHLHARGILCQNSDMILHPDPARASRSSPAPEGAGAVSCDSPREGGGKAPLRGTVDSSLEPDI